MERVKASLHSQKGGYVLSHNDGEQYAFDKGEHKAGRPNCTHFSPRKGGGYVETEGAEKVGMASRDAQAWYWKNLRREWRAAQESLSWRKNPTRRKTFEEFCGMARNQFVESIYQVGGKDFSDKDLAARATRAGWVAVEGYIDELNERAAANGSAARIDRVCADEHRDETTVHIHDLKAFLDENGKMNKDGCLKALGFEKAHPPRKRVPTRDGKTRPETKKEYEKRCTRTATFTAAVRQVFEDAVDAYFASEGLDLRLDRERGTAEHLSISDFKAKKRAEVEIAETRAEAEAALDARKHEQDERQKEQDEREKRLDAREKAVEAREVAADAQWREARAAKARYEGLYQQLCEWHEALCGWIDRVRDRLGDAILAPTKMHEYRCKKAGKRPDPVVMEVRRAALEFDAGFDSDTLPEFNPDVAGFSTAVDSRTRAATSPKTPQITREYNGGVTRQVRPTKQGDWFTR